MMDGPFVPLQIRQPGPHHDQLFGIGCNHAQLGLRRLGRAPLFVFALGKYVPAATGDFVVGPAGCHVGPVADDEVEVITHYREAEHVDGELPGQDFQPFLKPGFAVVVAFARDGVETAQKSASHATIDAVIDADFGEIEHELSRNAGHDNQTPAVTGSKQGRLWKRAKEPENGDSLR